MTPRELEYLQERVRVLEREYIYRRIEKFGEYEDGWLNGGGTKFDVMFLRQCSLIITSAANQFGIAPPVITPTVNGYVQAEWIINGSVLTIELRPDDTVEMFWTVMRSGDKYESGERTFRLERIDVLRDMVKAMNEFRERCE